MSEQTDDFHALFEALTDDQQQALFGTVFELAGRETPGSAASTEKLMRYWAEGEGAAKIRWGEPHDFYRCVDHLTKYVGANAKGLCSNLHQRALGVRPGKESQEAPVTGVPVHETVALAERATNRTGGRWAVTAISAGLGSSGYYSPEVLEDAGRRGLIGDGTHLFFDHPSESERKDRPERSVRDIAAVFKGPAIYNPSTQALEGEIQVFRPYRDLMEEMAPHIGLSISGSATDVTEGTVDGRKVPIIEGLHAIHSVDLVTKAGRGGAFSTLLESAREQMDQLVHDDPTLIEGADITDVPATRPDGNTHEETHMGTKQIEESEYTRLTETAGRVDTLEAEINDLKEQLAEAKKPPVKEGEEDKPVVTGPRKAVQEHIDQQDDRIARLEAREGARQVISEVLAEAWIGDAQKARLSAELMGELPMTEEHKLDEDALRTAATTAVNEAEAEALEILSAAGVGTPRGLGALSTPATEAAAQKYEDELRESYRQRGLSEAAAEIAVKGR